MKRSLLLVLSVVLLLAACGSSGHPSSFYDQPGPLPESLQAFQSELIGTSNPSQVPLVQSNFFEGCMGGEEEIAMLKSPRALASACGCMYRDLVKYLENNATEGQTAFDTYKKIDKSAGNEDSSLGQRYTSIFEECLGSV
ncbi:MAG: hypothetical protein P8J01_06640 [Acidimicrobiales bacterium]|nr:hypothetical protein [Acidimicrobiales bacterium]